MQYSRQLDRPPQRLCGVQVINPVQTNSIRSFYIRQAKTDPRDALLIAEVIRFGHFSESTLHPENI